MIRFIERNIHGAYVVWGDIGIRQYYGYTKKEARERYIAECKKLIVENKRG